LTVIKIPPSLFVFSISAISARSSKIRLEKNQTFSVTTTNEISTGHDVANGISDARAQLICREAAAAYTRNKTGVAVDIALGRALRAALDGHTANAVTVINTEFGRPFMVDGFSGFMRDAMRKAGLQLDCKPHGLRKTLESPCRCWCLGSRHHGRVRPPIKTFFIRNYSIV
jgi:hypothetical protein